MDILLIYLKDDEQAMTKGLLINTKLFCVCSTSSMKNFACKN